MTRKAATFEFRRIGGLEVLVWPWFDGLDADVIVTTRHGGVSRGPYATLNLGLHVGDWPAHVVENRRRVAAALGADLGDFVFCDQVHGRRAQVVTAADRGRGTRQLRDAIPGTDALVTNDPGTVLVAMMADCTPIILYDPAGQVLACVHAGWRGTLARVTETALAEMRSLGTRPENVLAAVGPAVAPSRYQVGHDVVAAADQCFGGHLDGIIRPDGSGRWLFDLWAANRRILLEAGLPDSQVLVAELPTGADPGAFFSHRETHRCGRFAAVARLKPHEHAVS